MPANYAISDGSSEKLRYCVVWKKYSDDREYTYWATLAQVGTQIRNIGQTTNVSEIAHFVRIV